MGIFPPRSPRRAMPRGVVLGAVAVTLIAITGSAPASAAGTAPLSAEPGPEHRPGLGEYGTTGVISRGMLPEPIAARVTDRAIELAQAPELAAARASWNVEMDFVNHLHYQLRFRSQMDFLSTDPSHLGAVLKARPQNLGIETLGLYLTDAEAKEFARREALGDRIPLIRDALGESEPSVEGEDPIHGPNFAGVWQDQLDGGAIVVALVDPALVDRGRLERIVGGSAHLRVIDVNYSWNEVQEFRDTLLEAITKRGVQAAVHINSTGQGRKLEVVSPDPALVPADILGLVPADLMSVVEGQLPVPGGRPKELHSEADQQPGLQLVTSAGVICTWGANGHTASYNYIVSAGHCGGSQYQNYNDWSSFEAWQAGSFELTPGSQYLWAINSGDFDMMRLSSPQADSNCYHVAPTVHCGRWIRWRALHNSWEINSDTVCASLGNTDTYECGLVVEENHPGGGTDCLGSRWVRYNIDTMGGDSGSGLIGPVASGSATIDAIHACGDGTQGFGNTAFDVKNQLGFDFNCASSAVTGRAAANWGACPSYNR